MNKIYRVIWSRAKHCYVVVSEMAKSRTKSNGSHVVKKTALAAMVLAGLSLSGMGMPSYAADNIIVDSGTAAGTTNTVTDDKTARIMGTENSVTGSEDANIIGDTNKVENSNNANIVGNNNTVSDTFYADNGTKDAPAPSVDVRIMGNNNEIRGSRKQHVIGDNNTIIGRDNGTVTDYGHPEGREYNISDLTIGRGNLIKNTDTYRNEWDALTVIGNNNRADYDTASAGGPTAGIVIGDNHNIDTIAESIVIGSLSPAERDMQVMNQDGDEIERYRVGRGSIAIGYHTSNLFGEGVVIGNYSEANGLFQTVMGPRSIINYSENGISAWDVSGQFASVYGAFNTIENKGTDGSIDALGNSITGTSNKTSGAFGTMIVGGANTVSNSVGPINEAMTQQWAFEAYGAATYYGLNASTGNIGYDNIRSALKELLANNSGAVSVIGNSNTSDYAIRSQILGTYNNLQGEENNLSAYNTVNGYANTGTKINRTSIVGTGNTITNGEDNVIIGDYHILDGGKRNVILGSMASEEKDVEKEYTFKVKGMDDRTVTYTVKEQVPTKQNTANIENAVMLGYNTDVTQSGGVALGAEAVASTPAGKAGYDPATKDASTDTTGTWKSTLAAVSVGDSTDSANVKTRQITNVAAGFADTDAVNVAQLKKVQTQLDANSVHYFSTNSSKTEAGTNYANDGATGTDSIVIGISSKSDGNNSVVLGNNTTVTGAKNGRNNSIVVGHSIEADGTHNAIFATDYNNGNNKLTKVFGEQNTVLGVGNLVGYTAVRNGNSWTYTKNKSGSDQNVAVGLTNTVSGGSVVIGTNSVVQALGTSIGHGNNILGDRYTGGDWRVAVGNYITATGDKAVAIGNGVNVNAWGAIGIGANDPIGVNRTIVTGKNAMAIGSRAQATDENALALGYKSVVTGKNAAAVGTNTKASEANGVALGSDSVADTAAGVVGYDPSTNAASTDTTSTWKATRAAVSVGGGTSGYTRQITNVAAGFADTDAVNVAQLKKVQTQLDSNSVHYFSTNSSQTGSGTNYLNDGATGTDSMVIGISSKSEGNNSTVLGNNVSVVGNKNNFNSSIVVGQNIDVDGTHNAVFATDYENGDYRVTKVFGEQNTVLGVGNLVGYTIEKNGSDYTYKKNSNGSDQNVAVGLLNTVSGGSIAVGTSSEVETLGTSFGHANKIQGSMMEGGQWRVALGNYLTVKGEMGLAIGNAAQVDGDWAIAIGNNNHDEEKTTTVKGESSIAMGTATTVDGGWATAVGSYSEVTGKSATAVGSYSIATGERATAFGNVAQAKEAFSLAVGAFSTAEAGQSVAIGGVNAKATVNHSVALGSFSTADRAGGAFGYDPLTKKESTSNTAVWRSVLGAVSVGGTIDYGNGVTGQATRQITNVAAGSADTDAVNVAQLKQVQQSVSDAVKEGKTTIEAGDNVTVEKGSTDNSYKISAKDTTLKDSDSALSLDGNKLKLEIEDTAGNKVSGSVELDKIGSAIDTKNTIAKAEGGHIDFTTKANEYGGTEYSLSVVTDGKVEAGNTGIVTGDTVYNETRVAKDGEYVKQANSAGENLSILDSQVKTNTESITNISNNVTNLNSRVSSLDTRINRVGAGAAALAALHPQDYDPSAKWDFAAGYGNYKSANAVAIGAFYRPTNDVLFSIGTSLGGGENMFNAGVSFKFGSSNEYSNYSKASLAEVVSEQSKQLEAQHSTIEALQSKVEKQEQENQELRAQVQEIMRQLSAQR
jgi:hypothetical protein